MFMDLSIFFLGTGGTTPSKHRGLPATLVRHGGRRLLFDCGEGTQRQMISSIGLTDIDAIFLTHYHTDHWLGLPGMLNSFALRERQKPLQIYGPPGLKKLLGESHHIYVRLSYELELTELSPGEQAQFPGFSVTAIPVKHSRFSYGYALIEPERPGRLDPALAVRLGIAPGPDLGRLQRGVAVRGISPGQVMGPARPGRKIVFSGDTAPCQALLEAARGADVLIHEASFLEDDRERAHKVSHSTAAQAAKLAAEAGVRFLALNHLSSRYTVREMRNEVRPHFSATHFPRDFESVTVPFPEDGPPKLHPKLVDPSLLFG